MGDRDRICLFYKTETTIGSIGPWKFFRKTRFEDSRAVFWSLSCYKEPKLTINPITGRTLRGLLIQMHASGQAEKTTFDFYFSLSFLPFFFPFLSSLFFLLFGI